VKSKSVLISAENVAIMIEMLTNYMIMYLNDPNYNENHLKSIFEQKQQLIIKLERLNAREVFQADKNEYNNIMSKVIKLENGLNK